MTCLGHKPDGSPCQREVRPPTGDVLHAHCPAHEARLTREAWGPVAWQDRAITHTLPTLVVGGIDRRDRAQGAGAGGGVPPVAPVSGSLRAAEVAV